MTRAPVAVLTVRDAQILQLLREGVSRERVLAIGLHRRSWTADDLRRVTTHWLPDGRPRALHAVPNDRQATIPPPRTPAQRTPGLRDLVLDLLSDPAVVARLREVLKPPVEPAPDAAPDAQIVVLTPRALDVANGLRDGLSNKDIAEKLNISFETVRTYVKRVFVALGATSRVQAALLLASGSVRVVAGSHGNGRPRGEDTPCPT